LILGRIQVNFNEVQKTTKTRNTEESGRSSAEQRRYVGKEGGRLGGTETEGVWGVWRGGWGVGRKRGSG